MQTINLDRYSSNAHQFRIYDINIVSLNFIEQQLLSTSQTWAYNNHLVLDDVVVRFIDNYFHLSYWSALMWVLHIDLLVLDFVTSLSIMLIDEHGVF